MFCLVCDKAKDGSSDHSKSAAAAEEEGGPPLVMSNKNQRAKDDQNLKVTATHTILS